MNVQDVLNRIVPVLGLNAASADIMDNGFEVSQIRSIMNSAGKEISERTAWPKLIKERVVVGGVTFDTLPSDFHQMPDKGTIRLNKPVYTPVINVVEPSVWAMLKSDKPAQMYYNLGNGVINFSSVLDADGATYDYVSNNWLDEDKNFIDDNTNVILFPPVLLELGTIYRWLRQKSMDYGDQLAEYEARLVSEIESARGLV